MKHIINISELKSSTYQSAADALKKHGHKRRVSDLESWAEKKRESERQVKIKELVDRIKTIGTFQIYFPDDIVIDSFLIIKISKDLFIDSYWNWIIGDSDSIHIDFELGILPVLRDESEEEDYKSSNFFKKNNPDDLGVHKIGEFYIHLGFMPEETEYFTSGIDYDELRNIYTENEYDPRIPYPINPRGILYKEDYHNSNWFFYNRREAAKFRKALIDIFRGNVEYDSTPDRPGGLKEDVMEFLISDNDYIGFEEFQNWINSLSRINVNRLYKD